MWFYHLQLVSFHFWQVNAFATPVLSHFYPTTVFHFFLPKVGSFNFRSIYMIPTFPKLTFPSLFLCYPGASLHCLLAVGWSMHFSKYREIRYFPCARRCGGLWGAGVGCGGLWGATVPHGAEALLCGPVQMPGLHRCQVSRQKKSDFGRVWGHREKLHPQVARWRVLSPHWGHGPRNGGASWSSIWTSESAKALI